MTALSNVRRFSIVFVACLAGTIVSAGCADDNEPAPVDSAAVTGDEDEVNGTTYADIASTFKADADYDAWINLKRGLRQGFDEICGDTFCGGDFSDLYSVNFTCSATEKTGKVRECLWTFGGSYTAIDGKTGKLNNVGRTFACKIPVGASRADFLKLAAGEPLRDALPGKTTSIYDALVGCFDSPPNLPLSTEGKYVDLNDVLGDTQWEKLGTARHNLRKGFDDVCGDTFCEGDYSDIESLSFRCSVDSTNNKVGACVWTFAGAYGNVAKSTGNVTSKRKSWSCALPTTGTVDQVLDALIVPSAIEATLPGANKSIYDTLVDCLLIVGRVGFPSPRAARPRHTSSTTAPSPKSWASRPREPVVETNAWV